MIRKKLDEFEKENEKLKKEVEKLQQHQLVPSISAKDLATRANTGQLGSNNVVEKAKFDKMEKDFMLVKEELERAKSNLSTSTLEKKKIRNIRKRK